MNNFVEFVTSFYIQVLFSTTVVPRPTIFDLKLILVSTFQFAIYHLTLTSVLWLIDFVTFLSAVVRSYNDYNYTICYDIRQMCLIDLIDCLTFCFASIQIS